MSERRPIEIIGGGLAGLAAGLALRRRDVPVTVVEAGVYPRHRVCGEFISGLDEETAQGLGMDEFLAGAQPHRAVTYHLRGRRLRPFPLPSTAWGISRHALDSRVASAFVAAGGDLRTGTRVPDAGAPAGRVWAAGRSRGGLHWVGLKVHARDMPLINDFEVHLGDRAYVGLSRVETGAVNVCGLFFRREVEERGVDLLGAYLRASGLVTLAERLRAADIDPSSFCVTAASLGDASVAAPDRIRIGDACATIAPFTGNGLAMALQGAVLAVDPLTAYSRGELSWPDAVRAVSSAQRRRFRRRLVFASLLHPFLLERRRQSCLATMAASRLLPFRALYAALR